MAQRNDGNEIKPKIFPLFPLSFLEREGWKSNSLGNRWRKEPPRFVDGLLSMKRIPCRSCFGCFISINNANNNLQCKWNYCAQNVCIVLYGILCACINIQFYFVFSWNILSIISVGLKRDFGHADVYMNYSRVSFTLMNVNSCRMMPTVFIVCSVFSLPLFCSHKHTHTRTHAHKLKIVYLCATFEREEAERNLSPWLWHKQSLKHWNK